MYLNYKPYVENPNAKLARRLAKMSKKELLEIIKKSNKIIEEVENNNVNKKK